MQLNIRVKVILLLLILGICFVIVIRSCWKVESELGIEWEEVLPGSEEKRCLHFVETALSSEWGIFTNFLHDGEIRDWATGHQVLSESEGLMMLYAVQSGDKELFDRHLKTVTSMILDDGVIAWRVGKDGERLTETSASIDDLRVIRALLFAYDRWGDDEYQRILQDLIQRTKKHELTVYGLVDYYDARTKTAATTVSLAYIDLYTMDLIARTDDDWAQAAAKGLEVIKGGFISNQAPFYRQCYDYAAKSYSMEDEINIIDYLKVLLHLSEVGRVPQQSIRWLRNQLDNYGALYNGYYVSTGQPSTDLQCSASYALGCRIATNIDDAELYKVMRDRLMSFQIRAEESELDGAWGDFGSKEVFSFDNLQAVLALQGSRIYLHSSED